MGLDNLKEDVTSALNTLKDGISGSPLGAATVAAGVGAVLGGAAIAGVAIAKKRKKKKSSSKRSRKKSPRGRSRRRRHKGRRTPRTAGKGKDRSTKRIRYTKNGQPYVITRSGRARFISKRGAKQSHKRKGGRY